MGDDDAAEAFSVRIRPTNRLLLIALVIAVMLAAACGGDDDGSASADSSTAGDSTEPEPAPDPTASESATEEPTATPAPQPTEEPTLPPEAEPESVDRLAAAEAFRSTFYTFDGDALAALLGDSPNAGFALFYQGWARGANYRVLDATPCEPTPDDRFRCSTTVEDDLLKALGILDFNVTDTFTIGIDDDGTIGTIMLTSDDPPEVRAAFDWVFANRPELFQNECQGFFDGGPTPSECAVSFVAAMADSIAE